MTTLRNHNLARNGSVAAAIVGVSAISASAASGHRVIEVVHSAPGITVTAIRQKGGQKIAQFEPGMMQIAACVGPLGPKAPCNFNLNPYSQRYVTPPGGSNGLIRASGTSYVDVYVVPFVAFTQADFYNIRSEALWGGISPWNCTWIKHADYWDIDYIATSWGFGAAPSPTLNFGNGRIGYESHLNNAYSLAHDINHVMLYVTGGTINKVRYDTSGSFLMGGVVYVENAYSSYSTT